MSQNNTTPPQANPLPNQASPQKTRSLEQAIAQVKAVNNQNPSTSLTQTIQQIPPKSVDPIPKVQNPIPDPQTPKK